MGVLLLLAPAAGAQGSQSEEIEALKRQVEALARQNAEMQDTIRALEDQVRIARPDPYAARQEAALLSRPLGGAARVQLLDVSLDILTAAGGSTAMNEELETLQGGEHDPRQRGFTFQQAELSFVGAVDPFLHGEAHLAYFIDAEGESRFELEEAFAQTRRLPFGLEERGLQLEVGQFLTEFGRLNPLHPHAWNWQDQPVVLSRFFGGDGIRQTGARLGWLAPLPWFSELHLGVQNAVGETMVSFLANEEVFEERPIGGRPFADRTVRSLRDLTWLLRWVNAWDLSDTWSAQLGASALLGPNATGDDGETQIYGGDLVVKWRPLHSDHGWPFVVLESEILRRRYEADAFDGTAPLAGEVLRDWGLYSQVLWGFRRSWAVGLRGEYATGSGADVEFDEAAQAWISEPRSSDPYRADRWRLSPLVVFHPSEYTRLRLQYNYDDDDALGGDAHSVWAGIEISFGAHPAHGY